MTMRRYLSVITSLLFVQSMQAQVVLADEDFDSFGSGSPISQTIGPPWATWGQVAGTNEEAVVSQEQAVSGTNSGKWVSTAPAGGPVDMVVLLDDRTTGVWSIGFKMYIPTGKGGYFNLLHEFAPPAYSWAMEVSFLPDGSIDFQVQGMTTTVGSYLHDTWHDVHVLIDLDGDVAELSVNGTVLRSWVFSWDSGATTGNLLQLAAVNFFAYAGGIGQATYYVDDLLITSVPDVGMRESVGGSIGLFPNPAMERIDVLMQPMSSAGRWVMRDLAGRAVQEGVFAPMTERTTLDVTGLRAGPYLFELQHDGMRRSERFMKQ